MSTLILALGSVFYNGGGGGARKIIMQQCSSFELGPEDGSEPDRQKDEIKTLQVEGVGCRKAQRIVGNRGVGQGTADNEIKM